MSWHGNMLIDIANSGNWGFPRDLSNMEEYGWGVNLDIISRFEFLIRMPKLNLRNNKTGMREEKSVWDFDGPFREDFPKYWLESFYEVVGIGSFFHVWTPALLHQGHKLPAHFRSFKIGDVWP